MKKDNKHVVYWLLTGCFLIFVMVVIGGITRLTHSGLSISDYRLVTGIVPPMSEQEWQEAFDLYKQFPEYQKLNYHYGIEEFKDIYFWEWLHRALGRIIGIVFILPFLYFLFTEQLTRKTIWKSVLLLVLGGFQGFLGWYMVKSGLVDRPDVSHYRLAMHLTTAFITFACTLWVALDIVSPVTKKVDPRLRTWAWSAMVILLVQIIYGAFVAGLDAGFIHNFWPWMADHKWIHETAYIELEPLWRNFVEGRSGVQFVHRTLAYGVVAVIAIFTSKAFKAGPDEAQANGLKALILLVILQFILGVATLLLQVPVWLGLAHQVGAFFLLSAMTYTLHEYSKVK